MAVIDIRQSRAWSNYLQMYGWISYTLPGGGIVRIANFLLFSIAKIHRAAYLSANDLSDLKNISRSHRVVYTKISPSIDQDLAVLENFGYARKGGIELPPTTSAINLKQEKATLWKNLTKDCRYSINKATKELAKTEIIQNPGKNAVENCYQVVKARSVKMHFYTPPLEDYLEKIKCFGDASFIANAYNSTGTLLGTKLFLGFNSCVWYMYSGLTELGENGCGNYKLMWDCINYFKAAGYTTLDMEGLVDGRLKHQSKNWKHYSDYKRQFNGSEVGYPLPYAKLSLGNIAPLNHKGIKQNPRR